jgi:hypothetical protein
MSRSDEYRRNAEECQRMADNTANESDKRSWLRLAESWMRMVRKEAGASVDGARQQASGAFESERRARGTHQRESKSAH